MWAISCSTAHWHIQVYRIFGFVIGSWRIKRRLTDVFWKYQYGITKQEFPFTRCWHVTTWRADLMLSTLWTLVCVQPQTEMVKDVHGSLKICECHTVTNTFLREITRHEAQKLSPHTSIAFWCTTVETWITRFSPHQINYAETQSDRKTAMSQWNISQILVGQLQLCPTSTILMALHGVQDCATCVVYVSLCACAYACACAECLSPCLAEGVRKLCGNNFVLCVLMLYWFTQSDPSHTLRTNVFAVFTASLWSGCVAS